VTRPQDTETITSPADRVQIALLGSPTVVWADQPLTIPRRQVRALLYRLAAAQQALAADPLAEELYRRLIALYAAVADRAAALREYARCAMVLERELGVEPLPETVALYEVVRDGRIAAAAWATAADPPV
jgi:adenine-specific DNA methylase